MSQKKANNGVGSNSKAAKDKTESGTPWKKMLVYEATWIDKDEFLDAVYWLRQIMGLILGVAWGFILLQGFVGLSLFLLTNCFVTYLYTTTYQNVDDEEYGGMTEILKEGMMSSFATFMVSWIIVYSAQLDGVDLAL